jgi:hypothetical protein
MDPPKLRKCDEPPDQGGARPVPGVRERGEVQVHNSTDLPSCHETDAGIFPDSPSLQGG